MLKSTLFNNNVSQPDNPQFNLTITRYINKPKKGQKMYNDFPSIKLESNTGNFRHYANILVETSLSNRKAKVGSLDRSFKTRLESCNYIGIANDKEFIAGLDTNANFLVIIRLNKDCTIKEYFYALIDFYLSWDIELTDKKRNGEADTPTGRFDTNLSDYKPFTNHRKILNSLNNNRVQISEQSSNDKLLADKLKEQEAILRYEYEKKLQEKDEEIASLKKQLESSPKEEIVEYNQNDVIYEENKQKLSRMIDLSDNHKRVILLLKDDDLYRSDIITRVTQVINILDNIAMTDEEIEYHLRT
ncbi:hypothetical protein ABXV22_07100 [Vibrio rotiferianus]|uniref:hypothetical protein n=1 Tax=Vibrio rotiferianus TaxID=190895 RepID=UPI0033945DF8